MNSKTEQAVYDRMWMESAPLVRSGAVQIDPYLKRQDEDTRRGVTLLLRPSTEVVNALLDFMAAIEVIEPDAYYYPPQDLHVTVLPIAAGVDAGRFSLPEHDAVLREVLHRFEPMEVDFSGVTLSREAVMMQGFAQRDALNGLREAVRDGLRAAGLGGDIDRRYKVTAAHSTFMRFAAPLRDPARLVDVLAEARTRDFGHSRVQMLELVGNDWFMHRVQVLRRYEGTAWEN